MLNLVSPEKIKDPPALFLVVHSDNAPCARVRIGATLARDHADRAAAILNSLAGCQNEVHRVIEYAAKLEKAR